MAGIAVNISIWLLFLLILLLAISYIYIKSVFRYFEKRGIPFEAPSFPFGNFTDTCLLKKSISFTLADIYANNVRHKMVGFFCLWKKKILIKDLEIIKNVLIKDFDIFQDRGVYYNKDKDPLSAHLFSLEGEDWRFLRAKLSPTFTSGKLKGMHSIILDCAHQLRSFVDTSMECESMCNKYAHTIISATAFGIDNNCMNDEKSKYFEMARKVVAPTAERLYMFLLFFNGLVPTFLNLRVVPKIASEFFMGLVKSTIKFREHSGMTRNDYLQNLIDLKNSTFEGKINFIK